MGVHQFVFPGVITLADGEFEAVLLYLYIKGLREPHAVNFRGFLFAQSAERAWYNWGETGLCQPYVAKDWLPRVWLRCARTWPCRALQCGKELPVPAICTQELAAAHVAAPRSFILAGIAEL